MKLKSWILALITASATLAHAATNDLTGLLQKGLFEEEANRNLDAAISEYQSLANAFDKDRQVAATAIFRLGECYRKLGRTNDALAQYQRIVRDFPDQSTLVTLSQQNMEGLGRSAQPSVEQPNAPLDEHAKELEIVRRLKSMPLDQVRQMAPTLLTDATLISLIYQYNQGDLTITRLLTDHGPDHPEVKKEQSMQKALAIKISERLDGLAQALSLEMEVSGAAQKQPAAADVSNTGVTDDEQKQIRNIQAMIQNSPDLINAPDSDGYTPLQLAAAKGQLTVAKYLLDHGADVNGRNRYRTALYAAAENGHKAMVELLLARGADVNAFRSLYQAVSKGFNEVAEVLLANRADVNLAGVNGESPLDAAARTGNTELVQSLIRHGADVNAKDVNGETPLAFAATANQTNAAKLLLAAQADVEAKDKGAETPLHKAASAGNTEMVSLLLDSGASVDATNVNDTTPLLLAVAGGHVDATRVLLEHKADPNHIGLVRSVASDRQPPVIMAIFIRNNEILKLLLDAGANPEGNLSSYSPLSTAIGKNNVDAVQLLLQHGADPNRIGSDGNPPLAEVLLIKADKRMVPLLLDKGADSNAKSSQGYAPLFLTVDPEIGRWLAEHKADVNTRGPNGNTPLIERWSPPEYLQFLLANGANPDLQDTNGNTALHEAVLSGRTNNVKVLLENKANPDIQNNAGDTPLDIAIRPLESPSPGAITQFSHEATETMIALLTKAGGLANLPKRDRIEVRRGSSYRSAIFLKNGHDWNRFSLLETIATAYGLLDSKTAGEWHATLDTRQSSFNRSLPFPDFKRVTIYRRTGNSTQQSELNEDIESLLTTGDCSRDVWLNWGDVVEIPETDHPVEEQWPGLSDSDTAPMIKCLARQVTITIKGESTTFKLAPQFTPARYPTDQMRTLVHTSFMLRSVLDNSKLIRVSSDLSRVKVTRVDPDTKKTVQWTVDCTNPSQADLWLRDGDVIDVPEK